MSLRLRTAAACMHASSSPSRRRVSSVHCAPMAVGAVARGGRTAQTSDCTCPTSQRGRRLVFASLLQMLMGGGMIGVAAGVLGFGSYSSHDLDDCLRDGDAGEFIAEVNNVISREGSFIHAVAFRLNRNGHIYIVERTGLEIGIHNEYRRPTRLTTVA